GTRVQVAVLLCKISRKWQANFHAALSHCCKLGPKVDMKACLEKLFRTRSSWVVTYLLDRRNISVSAKQRIDAQRENLTPSASALDSHPPCYNSVRKTAKGKCSAFRLRSGLNWPLTTGR
ncbi:MAG: hypothetical protein WBW31_22450, partial [Candidatus Sulfotelmatobacter sp.]